MPKKIYSDVLNLKQRFFFDQLMDSFKYYVLRINGQLSELLATFLYEWEALIGNAIETHKKFG